MSMPASRSAVREEPGKLMDNLVRLGHALREAGVRSDPVRIALAARAAMLVGVANRQDLEAALESVLVSREEDRRVFRALFDTWIDSFLAEDDHDDGGDPSAMVAPASLKPRGNAPLPLRESRRDGRDSSKACANEATEVPDASLSMSDRRRIRHADFGALDPADHRRVERLVREVALPMPTMQTRRLRPTANSGSGSRIHWPGVLREGFRTGGEMLRLPRLSRRVAPLPLLVLADVSGSMERYARLLLAFLHSATKRSRRRAVFAFGTHLTDLTPAFRKTDGDAMLAAAGKAISDFAGGTRLGESLNELRRHHAHHLIGRRTLVLVVTDGLDTGEAALLERELQWLRLHSRFLLWLNPLMRYGGYVPAARGAAVLRRHADAMLAVHDLHSLDQLAARLDRATRSAIRPAPAPWPRPFA